jgi:hypothetical protein
LELPNRNFDVGDLTRPGAYPGADQAYAKLVGKLSQHQFHGMAPELRSNILAFYAGASEPASPRNDKDAEKRKTDWAKLQGELTELRATSEESNVSRQAGEQ